MSTKNYKQLMEDVRTNEELAKKLEEADKEMRRTGDKAGFIKTAAELGYEVTEQDFPADDLVKLEDEQLDDVAGGWFGLSTEAEDEHEVGCMIRWYKGAESSSCPKSNSGKHNFVFQNGEDVFNNYICKYCGMEAFS